MNKTLAALLSVISNSDHQIAIANACDKAYAVGTGNPDWYAPYGAEKPEKVAQNLAGMCAVNSGIGILAAMNGATLPTEVDAQVLDILTNIANGDCNDVEKSVLLRLANATWAAGQPFRSDKGPLGRAKGINVFDLLPPEEVAKDMHQIQAAAGYLLQEVSKIVANPGTSAHGSRSACMREESSTFTGRAFFVD